ERRSDAAAWIAARVRGVDADTPGLARANVSPRGDGVRNAAVGLIAKRAPDVAGVGDDPHASARPRGACGIDGFEIGPPDVNREQDEEHQDRGDDHELDQCLAAFLSCPGRASPPGADHWTRPTEPMVCEP